MNSYVVNLYPVPNDGNLGETINVNSTVRSFTSAIDHKTTCCYITISGGDTYVTFDGSTPSSTNGHHLIVPYDRFWSKEATRVAKFLASGGNVAHVTMSQFTY
jgi:hypothetical protein